ncbi:MAG TPA: DinB family protein [Gemmatimonadales bacterium]|nr:DinB family protein [Gemmatimonadales bacterium]
MNVSDVRELFQFNAWANRRMFDALAALPTEQYRQDLKSSFGNIHGTLAHLVGAEKVWFARWQGQQPTALLKGDDVGSLQELRAMWEELDAERRQYLGGLTDALLGSTVVVRPTGGGKEYLHTLQQTIQHTVDHSSYHRGQIVTQLRQLGIKPPSTVFIGFLREQATQPASR